MCLICHAFCAREISELRQFRINPWIPGVKNYKLYVKFSWISDLWSLRWSKPTTSDFDPTNPSNFCDAFCAREISELRQFEINPWKPGVKNYKLYAKFSSYLDSMNSDRFRANLGSRKSCSDGIRTLCYPLWSVRAFRCIWTGYWRKTTPNSIPRSHKKS